MDIITIFLTNRHSSYIFRNTILKIMRKMSKNIIQIESTEENTFLYSLVNVQPIVISNLLGIIILSLLSVVLIG